MSHRVDTRIVVGQVVYSFDPRTPSASTTTRDDIDHVQRCERSARFARSAEARDEYDTWRAQLRQQGRA